MSETKNIQMVDLISQYNHIQEEIDQAVINVIRSSRYIGGPEVKNFEVELAEYLDVKHVISCANGTDALQIALMASDLKPGDEVIVPTFTYVATAEVIGLLGLIPKMVDCDYDTFNLTPEILEKSISQDTKAVVPVNMFGQSADLEGIRKICDAHNVIMIEDNAQAIGSDVYKSDGTTSKSGTVGHIGTTSFFPSKNLGCFGDGGAMFTNDDDLAAGLRMVANHGQSKRYYHDRLGVNSRLDAMQAAILRIKLRHLDRYNTSRAEAADRYNERFKALDQVKLPKVADFTNHVYHQYTLRILDGKRDGLIAHLKEHDIPSMIYYPVPLYKQKAFAKYWNEAVQFPVTDQLCDEVMSLPIHSEMTPSLIDHIADCVISYFE